MGPTIAAIVMVVVLTAWHLRTRRHHHWSSSADARFYVTTGYPFVAIAVYWLVNASSGTDWEWALGNLWAFFAMVSFVLGFNALNQPPQRTGPARGVGSPDNAARPAGEPPSIQLQRSRARDITTR